ncbi:MAG TPA: LamG-like jellyroll fold domain-containing protein [Lacunisphaera sp.]
MSLPFLRPCWRTAALVSALSLSPAVSPAAETVAFWAFDEPVGTYPSSVLSDHGPAERVLLLGPGGSLVPGRFGNALSTTKQPEIKLPEGGVLFGLTQVPTPPGRTVEPLSWQNAKFAALLTAGENHLRKEFPHANATETGLNLGAFDWTVEFWYQGAAVAADATEAVVFEVGTGPRGENDQITALRLAPGRRGFVLVNQPAKARIEIPSDVAALTTPGRWSHLAFVYDGTRRELRHYVDGRPAGPAIPAALQALPPGKEAYFSLGRDARWASPLPGALDEFRVSRGQVYAANFTPPESFVARPNAGAPARAAVVTEPLRFPSERAPGDLVSLGSSKHLLIDDALFPQRTNVSFVPVPPTKVELAYEVKGQFRKHVTVLEDEEGLIRIYNPIGPDDRLGVRTSRDGLNFDIPQLSTLVPGYPNVVTTGSTGTPAVLIDPLAPAEERWKIVSGNEGHGIFLHTSPDGYRWQRVPTAAISAWSGSQSNVFYDDQRGQYVGYHRSDMGENLFGKTERRFVMTVTDSLQTPWPFRPVNQAEYDRAAATLRLDKVRPWYLDNGPITPGGIGIEWPTVFLPTDGFDPDATDIYVPKAVKYRWAPDAYLAFPCMYFHYEEAGPPTRRVLAEKEHGRGSGPIETQLMVSRDGVKWTRYPRPVWLGVGLTDGFDIHQTYMAQGMVRRGDEIWMYSYNTEEYHSGGKTGKTLRRGLFRTVHRLDRFVAAEAPYDQEALMYSRPFTFTGKQLVLNVDTAASGWLQVGLQRGDGTAIPGYGLDDCVYVNGNELRYPVEWLGKGTDISALAGNPVRLVLRMRGSRLFSLQFTD